MVYIYCVLWSNKYNIIKREKKRKFANYMCESGDGHINKKPFEPWPRLFMAHLKLSLQKVSKL
jgi:hypothetical protein